jgi:hypothetical protein
MSSAEDQVAGIRSRHPGRRYPAGPEVQQPAQFVRLRHGWRYQAFPPTPSTARFVVRPHRGRHELDRVADLLVIAKPTLYSTLRPRILLWR